MNWTLLALIIALLTAGFTVGREVGQAEGKASERARYEAVWNYLRDVGICDYAERLHREMQCRASLKGSAS